MRWLLHGLLSIIFISSAGCGESDFHPLGGKVVLQGASDFSFSGDVLELRLEGDGHQRAFGEIKPDGSFDIETLHDGKIASGLTPGAYQGRIVFSDDNPQHLKVASRAIHRKFTRFETSGLKIQVPSENVILQVSTK